MTQAKLIYTCTKLRQTSWNFHIGPTSLWFFLGKVSLWCFFALYTNLFSHSQPAYTQAVLLQGWQTKIQQILFSFPKPVNRDNLGALIVAPPTSLPCPGVRVLGSATLNHYFLPRPQTGLCLSWSGCANQGVVESLAHSMVCFPPPCWVPSITSLKTCSSSWWSIAPVLAVSTQTLPWSFQPLAWAFTELTS